MTFYEFERLFCSKDLPGILCILLYRDMFTVVCGREGRSKGYVIIYETCSNEYMCSKK